MLTRDQIADRAWDLGADFASNVVDVFVHTLRRKIDGPFDRKLLQTVRGAGYVLRPATTGKKRSKPFRRAPLNAIGMGIRTRLTAWYVLVLCAGLIIFGAVLFFRSQQASSTALNQSLSDRASNLAQFVSVYPTVRLKAGASDEAAGQLGAASVWLRVLDLHGNQVASQGPPLAGVPDNLLGTLVGQVFWSAP